MTPKEIKEKAEASLEFFIKLIAPQECMGLFHKKAINWWEREDAKSHQLLLFPRDHGKSRYVAYRVVWYLTKDPTLRVLYISATANLAEKQLGFIKNILTSKIFQRYWPDHVGPDEGKRSKWTTTEIALDHPLRAKENVRDPSIFTAGLTTSITGMHADIAVLDDVVVKENAYNKEGRNRVQSQYSLLSSIEGADAKEWVVGTRYHPKDLYNDMLEMREDIYNDEGDKVGEEPIYEIYEEAVEDLGDGTGEFLWPRTQRKDGKWFGFDRKVLARKRGQYLDKMQFRAQYYNDPSDPDNPLITNFQYYDKKHLTLEKGNWYYRGAKLNLVAAVDFAYSKRQTADYTAIVVIGADYENNIYVLDIVRFKTDRISEYFDEILTLHTKWSFRKLRAEATAAQAAIVTALKEEAGRWSLGLKIDEVKPTRHQGSKEERIEAILSARYDNGQIYHYRSGNVQVLEDELTLRNPPHDDCKDALATAIDGMVKPTRNSMNRQNSNKIVWAGNRFRGARGAA